MDVELNANATRLVAAVVADHPDWHQYAGPYGPADDVEADEGSVIFSIPAPEQPHRLDIAQRGNTIEVAYDCGQHGVRAEQQFIFDETSLHETLLTLRQFLRDLHTGHIIIVREPPGRIVRAIRRDGVAELASFRTAQEAESLGPEITRLRWWEG